MPVRKLNFIAETLLGKDRTFSSIILLSRKMQARHFTEATASMPPVIALVLQYKFTFPSYRYLLLQQCNVSNSLTNRPSANCGHLCLVTCTQQWQWLFEFLHQEMDQAIFSFQPQFGHIGSDRREARWLHHEKR